MSKVIASTYEIIGHIGSGGGGNVYVANHLRLGKQVVLKADKRKNTSRPELLRREVDVLKELRHSYIPQVYDYFVEDGITYTVMDFIEGESLDKPLKRGECFSQPQVIKWAKQLLEALCYLHSPIHGEPPRGYVHSDIKPANLMRTPYNDICLIDFNIALALGEENVVGHSEGYASPEHYGLDYSLLGGEQTSREADTDAVSVTEETETIVQTEETVGGEEETVTMSSLQSKSSYKKIVPDIRSDIYSVGATLYHLLSGRRPARSAIDVIPLSEKEFSPQVVNIISKAMNPNPDLRYQTADEMLQAFLMLKENDPRMKQWRRKKRIVFSVIAALFCMGIVIAFVGLKRMQSAERAQKLAGDSQAALAEGDVAAAIHCALEAIPENIDLITPANPPEAQKALTDALGVYDLADGFKKRGTVKLQKNPLYLSTSPDGMTAVCMYENTIAVIDLQTMETVKTLPAVNSAMAEAEYFDNDTVVYAGAEGLSAYSISGDKDLWKGEAATAVSISAGGKSVASLYKEDSKAVIYNALSGETVREVDFGGRKQATSMVSDSFANPYNNLFELSSDGRWLAVSFNDGGLSVFDLQNDNAELKVLDGGSGYISFEGGFSGEYLAFSASNGQTSILAVIDMERAEQAVGLESENSFHTTTDHNGIYVQVKNILVKMNPATGEQTPLVTTDEEIEQFSVGEQYTAISSADKICVFDSGGKPVTEFGGMGETDILQMSGNVVLSGRIDTPEICVMEYEDNSQTEIAKYDPAFEHDEARVSADGQTVMLFSYKQFRICSPDGSILAEVQIPDAEDVYDQQYIREGDLSYFEVTYNNGRILTYDAETGELISETVAEIPDMTLYEEFSIDNFRIEAPLHGVPQVYDSETGKKICELDEDAYLIYITQANKYIIAQYVTAEGVCYGMLYDENWGTIASLPYLSDVKGNVLYFDYPEAGSLRMSEIHNLDSLVEMAKNEINSSG